MATESTSRQAGDIRFIKDIVFLSISPLILRARSFLLIPIIVRLLGAEGYGIWTQFEVTAALVANLASLNFGVGINRMLAGEVSREQISDDILSVISIQLGLGVLIVLPLLIWPGWIADLLFGSLELGPIAVALAVSILCSLVGNSFWGMMRAQRHTQTIALINSLRWWGELIVIVVALLISRSAAGLFVALAVYQVLANAAYPLYALRKGWWQLQWPRYTRTARYMRFSLPLFGENIGYWIANSSDKYVIRWLLGIEALGVYGALYKFGSIIMLLMEPLVEVLLPDTAALYDQRRMEEMQRRFALTLRYFAIIAALAAIGVVGGSRLLVAISGLDASAIQAYTALLACLAVGGVVMGLSRILHDLVYIKGQTGLIGLIWMGLGLSNIAANFILIPRMGLFGAALATLLTFLLGLGIVAFAIRQIYPTFRLWSGWILPVSIGLGVSTTVAWFGSIWLDWLLPVGALAGGVTFLATLLATRIIGRREIAFVRQLLGRRRASLGQ